MPQGFFIYIDIYSNQITENAMTELGFFMKAAESRRMVRADAEVRKLSHSRAEFLNIVTDK
jgi:hypothetical protein